MEHQILRIGEFMEGFWTVQFTGVQGWGAGVATFANGQVFGGDSGYMYVGTYTQQGNTVNAKVHVKPHVAGAVNVMGRAEFDLQLSGTLNGNTLVLTGSIPGTQLQLRGTLTKQHDLTTRAA
jgi:hypothetical protein